MDKCTALYQEQRLSLLPPWTELGQLPAKGNKRLWISPTEFLEVTNALQVARWAVVSSQALRPRLSDPARRGPKQVYVDESILLVALVHLAWQMGYGEVIDYFRAHPEAAQAAGFSGGRVISIGQYWERRRALGILPFWLLFVGMVWQLLRMSVIQGVDVILDSTTQKAWFHEDADAAWSFPKPWKGPVWGYKVHTLLCRHAQLPILFLVSPANRHDCLFAIPLLALAVAFFGLQIAVVRADAGYFTYAILGFIHDVLQASAVIDYNLRRRGKRALATLFFINQWRFHQRFRSTIERHFAWAKRYFGLESARWCGWVAAYQHTALVYTTMLAVALIAYRYQRPELSGSRSRVLAVKTLS